MFVFGFDVTCAFEGKQGIPVGEHMEEDVWFCSSAFYSHQLETYWLRFYLL